MAEKSLIEWTESSWNPITGCTKISDGCKYCYAENMTRRLKAMGQKKYQNGFKVTLHHDCLKDPSKWKKSRMIFVCSMSDIFHKDIHTDFILKVFNTMNINSQHTFQVLTKRPERLLKLSKQIKWTNNIWMGVTVESSKYINRIELLKQVPSKIRFLSIEPMLSSMPELSLRGIHWVIVGGESGLNSRPVKVEWVRDIKNQCQKDFVPFFFKQWGGRNKKKNGKNLDGKEFCEIPKNYN